MENYQFSAEIKELLNIIINFLYSDKEICIRELISNASDALEKLKTFNLLNGNSNNKFDIFITPNKEDKTLIIRDYGIGMTKQELITNLGTIAKSGTRDFVAKLKQQDNKNNNLIGQFGIGFYSSFLLGNKVVVKSRANNSDEVNLWYLDFSTSSDSFNVETIDDVDFNVGTEITIFIKDGEEKFLDDKILKDIIKKHSEYTNYPVYLLSTITETVENTVTDNTESENTDSENEESKLEKSEETPETPEKVTKTKTEYLQITSNLPLWKLKPQDISKEQYDNFYNNFCQINKIKNNGYEHVIHFNAEGTLDFTCLIFIPTMNKTEPRLDKKSKLQLYIKRVKIIETDKFLPTYFNFIQGLVDSDDLTVNVSRELLQNDNKLKIIGKRIHKKIIDNLIELNKNEPKKYLSLHQQYSKYFKLGYHEENDSVIKNKLVSLFLFNTLKHLENKITIDKYIEEMQEDQKNIYYISGENIATMEKSEFLQGIKKKNYDILFMTDNIDNFVLMSLKQHGDYNLVDVSKNCQDFENDVTEETINNFKTLCDYIEKKLKNQVSKVIISKRYMDINNVGLIVASEYGTNAQMEKLQRYQALGDGINNPFLKFIKRMKTFELNAENLIIQKMCTLYNSDNYELLDKLIFIVYSSALIKSGYEIDNTIDESTKVSDLEMFVDTSLELINNTTLNNIEQSSISKENKESDTNNSTEFNDNIEELNDNIDELNDPNIEELN